MPTWRHILVILFFLGMHSCAPETAVDDIEEVKQDVECTDTDIAISELDNIVIDHATSPVVWKGTYSESHVNIHFTKNIGTDGETETYAFVYAKNKGCLVMERAYKYYDGNHVDVSAVTEMEILENYTSEWRTDQKFTGYLIYRDPHDKEIYTHKFWVEFTEDDIENDTTDYLLFDRCLGNSLPIDIDMNADGIVDFKLTYEEDRDIGNRPQFRKYAIQLLSTNRSKNRILSPKRNQAPYSIIFEPPFSSANAAYYADGVNNILDYFYQFDSPYQNYNFFLNSFLTYHKTLVNDIDDYFIISMNLDDKIYYGWIKFTFDTSNCTAEILDSYLNNNPSEHVEVKN